MSEAGSLEVFGAGQLDVLSVGRGHLRLEVDPNDPEGIERARKVIEDMMQRGFAIFVETASGKTQRVRKFNPKKMTYIIDDLPEGETAPAPAKRGKKEVSATTTRATAVSRSAGG